MPPGDGLLFFLFYPGGQPLGGNDCPGRIFPENGPVERIPVPAVPNTDQLFDLPVLVFGVVSFLEVRVEELGDELPESRRETPLIGLDESLWRHPALPVHQPQDDHSLSDGHFPHILLEET